MSSDAWLHWYWGKEDKVEEGIRELEQLFRRKHVSTILDIGCGTGRSVIYLAKRGFRVSGFDWSVQAIRRAKALLRTQKLSAELKVWNMVTTPYPYEDCSFDAVLSIKVIHHTNLENINKIINEAERIIKKHGFLYLQAPSYERAVKLRRDGSKSPEIEPGTFLPLQGEEKGILHHHFTEEELLTLLSNFRIERMQVKEDYHICVTARKK